MRPRIPGSTVLEGCRPNYAKYFVKSQFGECSTCKPAYENYTVFLAASKELKPDIFLPATVSQYVRSRVCNTTEGAERHRCEDGKCKECSFTNYFINDPEVEKKFADDYGSIMSFEEEHSIKFFEKTAVEWKELESVGVDLPGKRKYDHLLYKTCKGIMKDFLLVFQRECVKLKQHKFFQHRCSERHLLSRLQNNTTLLAGVAAVYADYSQNPKKKSIKSGVFEQYRDMPDFSLLNLPCFVRQGSKPIRIDYHCVSDDPKHDSSLWPPSFRQVVDNLLATYPAIEHFEVTTDTSRKEFKSVPVFQRIAETVVIPLQKSVSLCNFGPQHGKHLSDGMGRVFEDRYNGKCVAALGIEADDLLKVAEYMNRKFGKPSSSKSEISKRITIYTPGVVHELSKYVSIAGTTTNHQFYIIPAKPNGVYMRRYWCNGCPSCRQKDFLSCTNKSCGKWSFREFKLRKAKKKSRELLKQKPERNQPERRKRSLEACNPKKRKKIAKH